MVPSHVEIYRVSGGLPVARALAHCPALARYLVQRDPPKLDLASRAGLILYNRTIARVVYGLDVEYEPTHALVPTPALRYSFLRRVVPPKSHILEVGTGPTALVSLLAARCFRCTGVATERDAGYARQARANVARNHLSRAIEVITSTGGILAGVVPPGPRFDCILCNPPYYPRVGFSPGPWGGTTGELASTGPAGEAFTLQLLRESPGFLRPGGGLALLLSSKREALLASVDAELAERRTPHVKFGLRAGTRIRVVYRVSRPAVD